jgi:hypothetical protein
MADHEDALDELTLKNAAQLEALKAFRHALALWREADSPADCEACAVLEADLPEEERRE